MQTNFKFRRMKSFDFTYHEKKYFSHIGHWPASRSFRPVLRSPNFNMSTFHLPAISQCTENYYVYSGTIQVVSFMNIKQAPRHGRLITNAHRLPYLL